MYATQVFSAMLVAASAGSGPDPHVDRPFVVAIDPGHGGTNAGCLAHDGAAHEKAVTLALAFALQRALKRRLPRAKVVLTRDSDATVPLPDRVAIANRHGADVLLSLHANASVRAGEQRGFETYVLDARASTLEAARIAQRENGSPTTPAPGPHAAAAALAELTAAANRAAAARLAAGIQRAQARRFPSRLDRGVKQAPFDVLLGAAMPAILFEAGFLDQADEAKMLLDERRRAVIADGLAEALVEYYRATTRAGAS